MRLLTFDFCSLNWADILISSIIGGIIGYLIVLAVDRTRLYYNRKKLVKLQGIFIASSKENPNRIQAIIKISIMKASHNTLEFSGTSVIASDYTGSIEIKGNNPRWGEGQYFHKTQNLKRGKFEGFGTLKVIVKSDDQFFVNQTFQRDNKDVQNPEVWNRVQGDDIRKSVISLKLKYMRLLKENQKTNPVLNSQNKTISGTIITPLPPPR